jgi:hypothetical protein
MMLAKIELSLATVNELARQPTEVDQLWQRQVEAAQHAARLAQCQVLLQTGELPLQVVVAHELPPDSALPTPIPRI